jgi:predicted alpha/beta-fold hydrolase
MLQLAQYVFSGRTKWKEVESEKFVDPEDGHTFSVRWATPFPRDEQTHLIVIIPGMLTNHSSKYLSHFIAELSRKAPTCICNMPLLADCATGDSIPNFSDDRYLRYFLEMTNLRHPQCRITLVGMSIGGTIAIKCADIVDKVVAVCSPIRGVDSWDSIQGFYYTIMRGAFLAGPMTRLLIRQPTKWTSNILSILKARDIKELTDTVEVQTSYVIYKMSIEENMLQLPAGKVTMVHTQDDTVVPYIPSASYLFAFVNRITLPTGGHLLFNQDQVRQIVSLV